MNHSLKTIHLTNNSNLGDRLGRLNDHHNLEAGDHDLGQHELVDVLLVVLLVVLLGLFVLIGPLLGLVVAGLELPGWLINE